MKKQLLCALGAVAVAVLIFPVGSAWGALCSSGWCYTGGQCQIGPDWNGTNCGGGSGNDCTSYCDGSVVTSGTVRWQCSNPCAGWDSTCPGNATVIKTCNKPCIGAVTYGFQCASGYTGSPTSCSSTCTAPCSCSCANNPITCMRGGSCSCSGSSPSYTTCTDNCGTGKCCDTSGTGTCKDTTQTGSDTAGSFTQTCTCT
ncbi:MAG: hypothetical protein FWC61_04890 [Proteobacteria bacterium]|nr:hypothetical protein [Pseudomonadota bacterium]